MKKIFALLISCTILCVNTYAQAPKKPNATEIYQSIKKLNFLGTALYLAAHPDDENTRLIAYLSNHVKARTAYLSLTRGDGGQNLIGPEIREQLGVIRTQELLAARTIDGGEQFFTRANDFGFSKHPDETLAIWNKEAVLSDVVRAIRQFKPDVIINRFDHRTPGKTHGHHTSSALLSLEAFDLTNNPTIYPEHLKNTDVWQPKRLFFNTSWWFYGSREKFKKADKSRLLQFNTGTYYPLKGLSNTEIAASSRSQHKSQGFGSTGTRGEQMEYLELIKGDLPKDKTNIFEGIDTSWNRVKGGQAIGEILNPLEDHFNFKNPADAIPDLLKAYALIKNLESTHWKTIKLKEIKTCIAACAGLYIEAATTTNTIAPSEALKVNIEVINRSPISMVLKRIELPFSNPINPSTTLNNNSIYKTSKDITIANNATWTTPYWLVNKGSLGMYQVNNPALIGKPETPRTLLAHFILSIENTEISYTKPLVFKTNDPVKGETYKPLEIIPEATVNMAQPVFVFNSNEAKDIPVTIKAGRDNLTGTVRISHKIDWNIFPKQQKITIAHKGESQTITFSVIPPKQQSEAVLKPEITINGKRYTHALSEIDYDHIPHQTVLLPSESKVVKLDIKTKGKHIGYIEGAGDVVPESLKQIGFDVSIIHPENITANQLNTFDAIILGVRAYNTVNTLQFKQDLLFNYVAQGGTMIVQYNTSHRLKVDPIAPYPLTLSRDRVTDEFSEVRFLNPQHPVLNTPNKITQNDFKGWVQERGLYFPNSWDSKFTPILGMHDKNESEKKGSLLIAKHGEGYYVYTGLSFFREFPAGVPGAYRLIANIIALGN